MIVLVLLSLVLIGIAVALVARGVMVSRFRTVDTLEQIGYYGFAGTIEQGVLGVQMQVNKLCVFHEGQFRTQINADS